MANDYIKLWVKDYRALLEPFNEAERGRILWAMMDYKETGSEPKFLGNERFVWAAIKAKIDASNEAYERQAAANRANGARGGRPRKSKENQGNPENRMGFEESGIFERGFEVDGRRRGQRMGGRPSVPRKVD